MKHYINHNFFETIDTEEKAYWLGFIAADGNINETHYSISLSLAEKDYDHLIKFKESLSLDWLPKRKSKPKDFFNNKRQTEYISYVYSFGSIKMYHDLLYYGIFPRKSLDLKPPQNLSEGLIRHWIRGYFDGDGSVYFDENHYLRLGITGTFDILEFISDFCHLSLIPKINKNSYQILSGSMKARDFLGFIYNNSTIFLERKKKLYEES